jgi:tetratricopeptide (TPR) repeat protein
MRNSIIGLVILLSAGHASAADQPVYAPAPAWVEQADIPKHTASDRTAAVRRLLEDVQDRLGPDGLDSYFERADLIQTPQGLDTVGTIALSWNPDTDRMIIHQLKIIRGDQTIDLLARGQKFTVLRRENNLERAMLDGTLTAAIEPEGLQVGDIIDFAFTREDRDPITRGHSGRIAHLPEVPTSHFHIRTLWPDSVTAQWRKADELGPAKLATVGNDHELVIDMTETQPTQAPAGAPARFADTGRFEISLAPSWADVSAIMAPLYSKAAQIPPGSPLRPEIEAIKAASTDPKARAAAALRLVQNKVRYVYLGMNNGGYVPADADITWSRRFGDCKGKTVLLLGILHELGIDAEAALVDTESGDGLDQRLPFVGSFDHVIVRTAIDGKIYWLDGTRTGDRGLDDLSIPAFEWALPVRTAGATLEKLAPLPLDKPGALSELRLDASAGFDAPAPAHAVLTLRGDAAMERRLKLANMTASQAEQDMREYWRGAYDFITVEKVAATYDDATGEERLSMDGSAKMDWQALSGGRRRYETDDSNVGWKADFNRDPGPHQDAPFAVPFPYFNSWAETIVLPNGGESFTIGGGDIDKALAGREFRRLSKIEKGVFSMEASVRSIAAEFPAAEAPAAKTAIRAMRDQTAYLIAAPVSQKDAGASGLTPEAVDRFLVNLLGGQPLNATAADMAAVALQRGAEALDKRDYDTAIRELDQAISLKPSARAYAARAIAYCWQNAFDKAQTDLDAARKLDPNEPVIFHGQGLLDYQNHAYQDTVVAFSDSIALNPRDVFAFYWRAAAHVALKEWDEALADYTEILQLDPNKDDAKLQRTEMFVLKRDGDRALAEVDGYLSSHASNPRAHALRASALRLVGRKDEAGPELDRSIALGPTVEAYLQRAQIRPQEEQDKALNDVDLALKLDPKSVRAYSVRAAIYTNSRAFDSALGALAEATRLEPADEGIRRMRAEIYASTRKFDLAIAEIDRNRAEHPDNPDSMNGSCWFRAVAGKDLEAALGLCNAALKLAPGVPSFLDSRGLAYLRLGRYDDAIQDYTAALQKQPKISTSLFGRAIAERRKGAAAEAKADLVAAHAANQKVEALFADYGITP